MKSPLIINNDPSSKDTKTINEKRLKFSRNPSRNSTSTQTSVNYTILSPQNSINSGSNIQSAILCRICYNSDVKEPLLQPCDCSGSMGLIHKTCLEKWLSQSNKNSCEICNYDYKVNRKLRPFAEWLCRPITTKDSKNLLNDILCFLILTPLAFISTWYCVGFTFKMPPNTSAWESSGLVILTSFLVVIYFLWFIFSMRYHYKVFKDWQDKNQIVTLQIENGKVLLSKKLMNTQKTPAISEENEQSSNHTDFELEMFENPTFYIVQTKSKSDEGDDRTNPDQCIVEV